jgi:hypothetical protein
MPKTIKDHQFAAVRNSYQTHAINWPPVLRCRKGEQTLRGPGPYTGGTAH